ncbi:ATP-binding protein [Arcticibacter tournemirensis]|uniref:tetratricopeptide repeat-containing sensor histidine kinase n=1 Tax=Arcticibacter tournemirensis TaxID=699437 RepID=UPI001F330ABA|nr:ATP-binding protein [Arcticibacter tournemirensis]
MYYRLSLLLLLITGFLACRREDPPPPPIIISPELQKAESFLDKQNDSAFYYLNKVATASKDSLQIAIAYNEMAVIQSDAGDYFGAQESLSMSLRFLDHRNEKHYKCLASDYNELGVASIKLQHYTVAPGYFDLALRFSNDHKFRLAINNNKALAYQRMNNYPEALKIYSKILPQTARKKTYARILTNMAISKWRHHPDYNPLGELLRALKIRRDEKDLWGLSASFAHLAEYYTQSRPDSALFYAKAMHEAARQIGSPDDELEALGYLIRLSEPKAAKAFFGKYQQLNDSLVNARRAAGNQFALIRYDVERNQTENLRLQKDNAEKKYQLVVRNVLLISAFVVLLILMIVARMRYNKWKKRKELEKQEAILETRRKASKDVHDSLSNDIYLLMKRIKHDEVLDRSWLQSHTELVYKRSRNISYEILADTDEFFPARIGDLLKSFGTENTKVLVVGNEQALWQRVGAEAKLELKYVLQEMMVNMQKHSRAANVVVKFEAKGDTCHITYIDDGIGIEPGTVHQNGLTNTGTRINSIRGRIIFGANEGKGLRIDISFPFA